MSGYAFIVKINIVRTNTPVVIISKRCFIGYPPKKQIIKTNTNKIAAVEKLAGKIKARTINTGIQSGTIVLEKATTSSLILARYLAM
tara:strand:- start:99 stop:359 length:261 start_codon:yes stop_codon:yes gene_type:complete